MLGFVYLIIVSRVTATMGVVILCRRISLFMRGARARGIFTRWESRGVRITYYHPVVRFTANDGREYEFVGCPGSTKNKERSTYEIVYPSNAPEKALVLSFLAFWAAPPVFVILSAGAAIAAF